MGLARRSKRGTTGNTRTKGQILYNEMIGHRGKQGQNKVLIKTRKIEERVRLGAGAHWCRMQELQFERDKKKYINLSNPTFSLMRSNLGHYCLFQPYLTNPQSYTCRFSLDWPVTHCVYLVVKVKWLLLPVDYRRRAHLELWFSRLGYRPEWTHCQASTHHPSPHLGNRSEEVTEFIGWIYVCVCICEITWWVKQQH